MKKNSTASFLITDNKKNFLALVLFSAALFFAYEGSFLPWDTKSTWGGRLVLLVIGVPYLLYRYSGNMLVIDTFSKSISIVFSIFKIPVGYKSPTHLFAKEVFLLPKVISMKPVLSDQIHYSLCIGEFREGADDASYKTLRKDMNKFDSAEIFVRDIAKKLNIPGRIYWSHAFKNQEDSVKEAPHLDSPFEEVLLEKAEQKS